MRILSVIFSLFVLSYLTVRDMAAQSVVRDTVLVYFEQGLSGIAPSLRGNQKSLDSIAAITGRYSRNPQFHLYVKGWA